MIDILIIPTTIGLMIGGILTILYMSDKDVTLRSLSEAIEFILAPQMFVYQENNKRLTRAGMIVLEVIVSIFCYAANIIIFIAVLICELITLMWRLYLKIFKKKDETL